MSDRPACPRADHRRRSCKRWDCEVCGPLVARDWLTSIRLNLEWLERPVVVVALTAPGADVLPWNDCACTARYDVVDGRRVPHTKHSGTRGCRVQDRYVREWSSTLPYRFRRLFDSARKRVRDAGYDVPPVLERVWELQTRGAPHWHGVFAYGPPREREAVRLFVAALDELAPRWGFGYVQRRLEPKTGAEAARYVAKYFMGRKDGKATVRETLHRVRAMQLDGVPRSLLWQSWRQLTQHTGFTIRYLRRARHLLAWSRGLCTPPRWVSRAERDVVSRVLRTVYNVDVHAPPFRHRPSLTDWLLAADYHPGGLVGVQAAVAA